MTKNVNPKQECIVRDCLRPRYKKNKVHPRCETHHRQHIGGTAVNQISETTIERFWGFVRKTDYCWDWLGAPNGQGYGIIYIGVFDGVRKYDRGHRVSYEMHKGAIPEGCEIDHMCRNKLCVNPDHLRAATRKENMENHSGIPKAGGKNRHRNVYLNKRSGNYFVKVRKDGQEFHGGTFSDPNDANNAAIALRNKLFRYNFIDRKKCPDYRGINSLRRQNDE